MPVLMLALLTLVHVETVARVARCIDYINGMIRKLHNAMFMLLAIR